MTARPADLTRTCLALAALTLMTVGGPSWAQAGKQAWTKARVSSGLHSLDHAATVTYRPATAVPTGSVITQVYADRDYAGQADVQTSLCWGGTQRCVDIVGRSVNTRAFNGLDAAQPMFLVHRARAWRGSPKPLYVKGNVTVWFEPVAPAAPR